MIVVGLGSNLGSREAFLRAAELLLDAHPDLEVAARSSLYLTPPMGPPQPDYLNAALRLETALHPRSLLPILLGVERDLGRVRTERWGPRTLDLDILFWSGGEVDDPDLVVPHAGLTERPFALAPLLDVAPSLAARYTVAPPPRRPWTEVSDDALDALDARAFEVSRALGPPGVVSRVEPFEGRIPTDGPGFVVLERWDDAARRGSKLL